MIHLRLPGYDGPLDLLLRLVEQNDLDISALSLRDVADQYMQHIEEIQADGSDALADSLAEFLVIGAKLMQLKSRALVRREVPEEIGDDASEEGEDPGKALAERLLQHRRYRDTVDLLQGIDTGGLRAFPSSVGAATETDAPVGLPDGVTLDLLTRIVREALERAEERAAADHAVELEPEPATVAEKITDLRARVRRGERVSFRAWIAEARTRVEIIVTFMAILELYKAREIEMQQDEMYGDILVVPAPAS